MSNSFRKGEVPLGFGMALARNIEALNRFALMTESERRSVIEGAHNVRSRGEMRDYVNNIPQM